MMRRLSCAVFGISLPPFSPLRASSRANAGNINTATNGIITTMTSTPGRDNMPARMIKSMVHSTLLYLRVQIEVQRPETNEFRGSQKSKTTLRSTHWFIMVYVRYLTTGTNVYRNALRRIKWTRSVRPFQPQAGRHEKIVPFRAKGKVGLPVSWKCSQSQIGLQK